MKKFLKSNKIVKIALGTSLAVLIGSVGVFHAINYINNSSQIEESTYTQTENTAVQLSPKGYAKDVAENFEVSDYIAKDENGDFIRFEAFEGKPIDVIVDENSVWCMTDNVKQGIKQAIEQYNKMFSFINPDYSFRYISSKEYEKNPTNDPFIYITTNLSLQTSGGSARAVTSPAEGKSSKYNGTVDSDSVIIISSTGTVFLTVDEIQNVVAHEIAHALGYASHSNDQESIMYTTSNGITISSNYFSQDLLYSMLSLYYNPQTNPNSYQDIKAYIKDQANKRNNEISEYKASHEEETVQDKETVQEQDYLQMYLQHLQEFTTSQNSKPANVLDAMNKSFSSTSMYGQTVTFTFLDDYSYVIEVSDNSRQISCKGNYKIENNTIVCDGQYFTVENGNYVNTTDTIYFSLLSNGEAIYGVKSDNATISSSLEEVIQNEITLN